MGICANDITVAMCNNDIEKNGNVAKEYTKQVFNYAQL